jgi:hypothetical protein
VKASILITAIALLLFPAVGVGSTPAPVKVSATMTPGQVVPKKPKGNVADATGTFTGTLTKGTKRWNLAWRLSYAKLDHPSIVIADIHYGKPGHFGQLLVRLCGPCKTGQRGTKPVTAATLRDIKTGVAFITLITGKNPNGEIRGQIKVR